MEKALKDFFDSLLVQRKKCPWAKSRSIEQQLPELESEIQEFKQAIARNDLENMREEYGDMLWDALFIGIIAEEKGLFSIRDAIQEAHAKLRRRKPWVFGNEKVKTPEEAVKRWNEIKADEKKAKSRH
ncbi:MAG: MazG nucleotide pyrophosphohydrolase domain-containing protein [archaeon]